jgi:hypothetical protein
LDGSRWGRGPGFHEGFDNLGRNMDVIWKLKRLNLEGAA